MPPLPDTEAVLRLWPWHGGMGWEKFPSDDLSALPRTVYAAFAAAGAQRRSRKKLHTMYLLLFSSSPGRKVHTHSVSQPAKAAPQTFSRPPPSKILRTHDYTRYTAFKKVFSHTFMISLLNDPIPCCILRRRFPDIFIRSVEAEEQNFGNSRRSQLVWSEIESTSFDLLLSRYHSMGWCGEGSISSSTWSPIDTQRCTDTITKWLKLILEM